MSDSSTKPAAQDGLAFERPLTDLQTKIDELRSLNSGSHLELLDEIELLEERLKRQTEEVYANLSPWERVNVARHADRPLTQDYIALMLDDFVELHGDRLYGDDRAIVCGLATMGEHRFLLVGHRKGKTVKDRLALPSSSFTRPPEPLDPSQLEPDTPLTRASIRRHTDTLYGLATSMSPPRAPPPFAKCLLI